MFKSNKLILFKLEAEDLQELWKLKQESWETTHNVTIANHSDQDRWYASLDQNVHCPCNLVLVARELRQGVDSVGPKVGIYKISNVDYISQSADVAWDIFADFRGKGFGKKIVAAGVNFCFDVLNLRRMTAEILSINEPSRKCAKAAGFVLEGTKKESIHKKGKFLDSEIWGLLSYEIIDQ